MSNIKQNVSDEELQIMKIVAGLQKFGYEATPEQLVLAQPLVKKGWIAQSGFKLKITDEGQWAVFGSAKSLG